MYLLIVVSKKTTADLLNILNVEFFTQILYVSIYLPLFDTMCWKTEYNQYL